jgi:hypothetical protein
VGAGERGSLRRFAAAESAPEPCSAQRDQLAPRLPFWCGLDHYRTVTGNAHLHASGGVDLPNVSSRSSAAARRDALRHPTGTPTRTRNASQLNSFIYWFVIDLLYLFIRYLFGIMAGARLASRAIRIGAGSNAFRTSRGGTGLLGAHGRAGISARPMPAAARVRWHAHVRASLPSMTSLG